MRKDARIGLVLGGIILAVLAVFVMLPSSKKPVDAQAHLDGADTGDMVNVTPSPAPGAGQPIASDSTDVAVNNHQSTDPFASNTVPVTQTPSAGNDWGNLLQNGSMPLMTTSETPAVTTPVRQAPSVPSLVPDTTGAVVRTYTVKSGDTLVAISKAEYGTTQHVDLIQKANPQVKDPRKLKIGMVLKIPPLTNPDSSATTPTTAIN